MEQVDELKYWLATAPVNWDSDQNIRRYLLPTGEYISCVLWNSLYHITGTDIVRSLVFRFQAFGRPVTNIKKFEEGVFSDLRNLKPGMDASLEEPKTQKKQKVFYWFSVPHDRLFLDALERDLKREKMGIEPTTVARAEPALSFSFDSTQSLYDQFTKGISPGSSAPPSPQLRSLVFDHSLTPMAPAMIPIKTDDPSGVLYPLDQESMGNTASAQPSL
ncbi:5716_t:CDS:2, partial [Racocetra fulgida]